MAVIILTLRQIRVRRQIGGASRPQRYESECEPTLCRSSLSVVDVRAAAGFRLNKNSEAATLIGTWFQPNHWVYSNVRCSS
jgi:preprotein translocase subunit SecY